MKPMRTQKRNILGIESALIWILKGQIQYVMLGHNIHANCKESGTVMEKESIQNNLKFNSLHMILKIMLYFKIF